MLGFVESKPKRRPERPNRQPNEKSMFFWGLLMIIGFSIALVPFGAYLPVSISIWALIILFLPLLLIGISLISKYGYSILFSVFFAIFGGATSILFLGDFVGYITQLTVAREISPEEAIRYAHYKYIFLKDFDLDETKSGSFLAHINVRKRGTGTYYGPLLQFRYAPIYAKGKEKKDLGLYALCYSKPEESCAFAKETKGGNVLREALWETDKTDAKGESPKEHSIFLVWRGESESEIFKKGMGSLAYLAVLILTWFYICFRQRKRNQSSNP
ncbi:hypothetical protein LPTSP4_01940 [Leptospira ryugenii]|uniref:Uncharacterized protein n=1 Tax=Leptospira ryugenii TaxID=1917863 RepID=A0A2P2DVP8_9LEPT|nr:hypothetical protein [Leptospira ryugenii]GBF48694.1 hypothetical protein LPTSP4_01940 [Leptospira ryugenii]